MIKLHWLIDIDIIGDEHQETPMRLRQLGHKVSTLSATKDTPKLIKNPETIYVFHGSFEELNAIKKQEVDIATYGLGSSILRSHYTSYTPEEWYLNQEATMTTWGMFRKNFENFFHHFKNNAVFIRPDSGVKTFTGQLIDVGCFNVDADGLEKVSNVKFETIIWVSPKKEIEAEYRFWICNKNVVASTEYSWDDKELGDIPDTAIHLAEIVAKYEWQVDRTYVVDIAICNGSPFVVEFNSFSCSGLYNCDSKKLFELVSNDILLEWSE